MLLSKFSKNHVVSILSGNVSIVPLICVVRIMEENGQHGQTTCAAR